MVNLILEEDSVVIHLSFLESLGAFSWCCCACAPFQIPYSAIESVRAVNNLWNEKRGIRVGTGIPGVIALGSLWKFSEQDFCAIYGSQPGIVIEIKDEEIPRYRYHRFIFSVHDHVELAQEIIRQLEE